MKHIFGFVILLVFFSANLFAQSSWDWINPANTSVVFRDGCRSTSGTGFVCGDGGVVLKTTDFGNSFAKLSAPSHINYNSIKFVNAATGYLSGSMRNLGSKYGVVLKTTDGGNSWFTINSQQNARYNIEVLGNFIYLYDTETTGANKRSSDGGATWATLSVYNLSSIKFVNTTTAFACKDRAIYKSTNSGESFSTIYNTNLTYGTKLTDVHFYNETFGTVVGENGRIFYTNNGGASWLDVSLSQNLFLTSVEMYSPNLIYITSSNGKIILSTNSGYQWQISSLDNTLGVNGVVSFMDQYQNALAYGQTGFIAVSSWNNNNWLRKFPYTSESNSCRDIDFPNASTGYALFDGGRLLKTTDGGINFDLKTFPALGYDYYSLKFKNENTGFIGGGSGRIYRTTNGANDWTLLNYSTAYWIIDIEFAGEDIFATGSNGTLLKSTNSGLNWIYVINPVPGDQIYSAEFLNESTGYISSYKIFKTQDKGNTWTNVTPYTAAQTAFHKVHFINANTGFAAAEVIPAAGGRIYKTTDGGNNWSMILGHNIAMYNVHFVNELTGYASGSYGHVYKTVNGGSTWQIIYNTGDIMYTPPIPPNEPVIWMKALFPVTDNMIFAGGSFGTFIKSNVGGIITNTGGEPQVQNVITDYELSQNYPNPFNPSTTIGFKLPKESIVRIRIFDISGREVETLMNEKVNAGTHSVNWNAGKYTSGVYFYRMETSDFTAVKKMMLIK